MRHEDNHGNKMEIFNPRSAALERRAPYPLAYPAFVEKGPDLVGWCRMIRKRRWTILTAFALVFGAFLAVSLKQKPLYRAKSLIEIDKESPSVFTPQELFQLDEVSDDYLETQYKVLASDDLAERVIHQLALDEQGEFRPTPRAWPLDEIATIRRAFGFGAKNAGRPSEILQEAVLAKFKARLDIRPVRRSRAVEIRFDSQDPALAARVVNAVSDNYIQKNLEARWDAAQKTSEWLSQQLQDLKAKLEKSEEDAQKYAAENGLLFLETDKGSAESVLNQSVRELQEELTRAQADRFDKESLYRLLQSADTASLPGVLDNHLLQDLSERLADLQRERARLSSTFTDEYPKVKEIQGQIAEIQSSLDRERRRAAQKISNDYFAAVRRENLVQQAFLQIEKEANEFAEKSVQYGILSREVDTNKGLYDGLLQRLKEAGVSAGLKASNIRVVDPGIPSFRPVSPNLPVNLGLAGFLGLGLGVFLAFLREHLDQTIRDGADVDLFLGIPVLGFVPKSEFLNGRKSGRGEGRARAVLAARFKSSREHVLGIPGLSAGPGRTIENQNRRGRELLMPPPFSEAFRELRTSVILSGEGRGANSILVTSAQPSDGKTTVAVNLAISLAQLGHPVLLVDADLRCPSVHKHFPQTGAGCTYSPPEKSASCTLALSDFGEACSPPQKDSQLSAYLAGQGAWQEMVVPTPVHHLSVLHCGPVPENPCELLSSERMRALLREAIATYRFVILDSPPLLKGADSRILGSMAGVTLLVVKGGQTLRQVAQFAESQARSVGTNLIGVVLNHFDAERNHFAYAASPRWKQAAGAA